jgi:choline dehydrogenase-like flavoprotein
MPNRDADVDVVVVGAGSAGAALAGRLSEEPATSVLLLEAGPDGAPPALQGPNFFGALTEPGRLWPELVATRTPGQPPSLYVRGRGIGGSSAVNAMCAIRGTVDDYERWAAELGCDGWGWPEILDAFLRVEDDVDYGGDRLHGRGGPIPLSRVPEASRAPFDRAMRAAIAGLGHPEADDYHAPGATGLSRAALTLRDGRRVSASDGYLAPARQRANLEVRANVLVDRVLLDGRRAVGVRTAAGDEIEAGEVIIAAGAIHSPAILLRSGIGTSDGRPVGANLKEHAATPGFEVELAEPARMPTPAAPVLTSLLRLTSSSGAGGPNDLQIVWFNAVGPTAVELRGGRVMGALMRVFSSGSVRLRAPDPHVDPVVEFDMLSDERDRVRLRELVHRMLDIVRHPAVASIATSIVARETPIGELDSDDAIDAWLSATVTDYVHAAGTCRMGRRDDPAAVVDTDCRVIGYEALRVCDASVMPDLPKANTHLTTVAIAERLVAKMRAQS